MLKSLEFKDFQNICRTCMFNNDLQPIQDNRIIEVLQHITDIKYVQNDELPQQICANCIIKIQDIHAFVLQCKSADLTLKECLNKHINEPIQVKQEIVENTNVVYIKEEHMIPSDDDEEEEDYSVNNDPLNESVLIKKIKLEEETTDSINTTNNEVIYNKTKKIKQTEFQCDICKKIFNRASTLKTHTKIHSDARPYKCDVCPRAFKILGDLGKHKRIHSDVRLFKCDMCSKGFNLSSSLLIHKRVHSGERPYKCETCPKTFNNASNLTVHKRIHTGERPYKCKICEKSFVDFCGLFKHKRIHGRAFINRCDVCSKEFKKAGNLTRHKMTCRKE